MVHTCPCRTGAAFLKWFDWPEKWAGAVEAPGGVRRRHGFWSHQE